MNDKIDNTKFEVVRMPQLHGSLKIGSEHIGTYTINSYLKCFFYAEKDGIVFDYYYLFQKCTFSPERDVALGTGNNGYAPFLTTEYILESIPLGPSEAISDHVIYLAPDFNPANAIQERQYKESTTIGGSLKFGYPWAIEAGVEGNHTWEHQYSFSDLKVISHCGSGEGGNIPKWSFCLDRADIDLNGAHTPYTRHKVVGMAPNIAKGTFQPEVQWAWQINRDVAKRTQVYSTDNKFKFQTILTIYFTEIRRPNPAKAFRDEGPYKIQFNYEVSLPTQDLGTLKEAQVPAYASSKNAKNLTKEIER
jgi:hypothetical protein